jgi:hypothetical protein
MHMLSKLAVAGALAVNVAVAGTAAAATYTATYTDIVEGTGVAVGTDIVEGIDADGLFSAAGTSLDGASFTAVFTYDLALSGTAVRDTVPGSSDIIFGGLSYGTTSPILSDSLTINGISFSLDLSQYGTAVAVDSELFETVAESPTGSLFTGGAGDPNLSIVPNLAATQSYSGFLAYELASGIYGRFIYGDDYLLLGANAVDISAVPEPGSLALMATAVGLLGFAARRRSA